MTNLDSILKSRDITLPTKVHLVKAVDFPGKILEWGAIAFSVYQPRQPIKKQRHYLANKGPSSQGYGFSHWSCMDVRVGL